MSSAGKGNHPCPPRAKLEAKVDDKLYEPMWWKLSDETYRMAYTVPAEKFAWLDDVSDFMYATPVEMLERFTDDDPYPPSLSGDGSGYTIVRTQQSNDLTKAHAKLNQDASRISICVSIKALPKELKHKILLCLIECKHVDIDGYTYQVGELDRVSVSKAIKRPKKVPAKARKVRKVGTLRLRNALMQAVRSTINGCVRYRIDVDIPDAGLVTINTLWNLGVKIHGLNFMRKSIASLVYGLAEVCKQAKSSDSYKGLGWSKELEKWVLTMEAGFIEAGVSAGKPRLLKAERIIYLSEAINNLVGDGPKITIVCSKCAKSTDTIWEFVATCSNCGNRAYGIATDIKTKIPLIEKMIRQSKQSTPRAMSGTAT